MRIVDWGCKIGTLHSAAPLAKMDLFLVLVSFFHNRSQDLVLDWSVQHQMVFVYPWMAQGQRVCSIDPLAHQLLVAWDDRTNPRVDFSDFRSRILAIGCNLYLP